MSIKYTRDEILGILAARHGHPEAQGPGSYLTFTIKVSPELLEGMLGGTWTNADGSTARFDGVYVEDDGFAEPILSKIEARA